MPSQPEQQHMTLVLLPLQFDKRTFSKDYLQQQLFIHNHFNHKLSMWRHVFGCYQYVKVVNVLLHSG